VDGAYGALFVLADQMEKRLRACGRADSVALDPHKLLFAPLEAGCLIVRDREKLRKTFHFTSSYLPADPDPLLTDFLEYGPQLSRNFKAFKIWCSLQVFGVEAFRSAARRMLDLGRYMAERIGAEPALELMAPVELTVVCFRYKNGASTRTALAKLVAEGTAILAAFARASRTTEPRSVTSTSFWIAWSSSGKMLVEFAERGAGVQSTWSD
jgi:aromatic-L-amino-acid decarboxylase